MREQRFARIRRGSALLAVSIWSSALAAPGPASAGRERIVEPGLERQAPPATPEPGAAIAFGLGVGVIAWAARRHRKR
jgi:hypothetical protein